MLLACKLYEMGWLSMEQAAELAGYNKRTFMELLSRYNTSIFNYNIPDLENDIRNAHSHLIRSDK